MVLSKTARGVMGGEENERMGTDIVGSVVMLRKSVARREISVCGHIVKNSIERRRIQGKVEGKWRSGTMIRRCSVFRYITS